MIGELIGIPPEAREAFLDWTDALVEASPDGDGAERVRGAGGGHLRASSRRCSTERRREPRDDLASALLDAEIDGVRLTQPELLGFCFVLIVAGNDTTTNLIANGAVLLARHPEQRQAPGRGAGADPERDRGDAPLESPAQALPRSRRAR